MKTLLAFSVDPSNRKSNKKSAQKTRAVQLCDLTGIDASFISSRNVWQWAVPEMVDLLNRFIQKKRIYICVYNSRKSI
uniref:Uncharacterized protein n=1 Tax=Ditylenchus dipsaci TaxID=166011 RepID=A0A915E5G9_9BILA